MAELAAVRFDDMVIFTAIADHLSAVALMDGNTRAGPLGPSLRGCRGEPAGGIKANSPPDTDHPEGTCEKKR